MGSRFEEQRKFRSPYMTMGFCLYYVLADWFISTYHKAVDVNRDIILILKSSITPPPPAPPPSSCLARSSQPTHVKILQNTHLSELPPSLRAKPTQGLIFSEARKPYAKLAGRGRRAGARGI